MGTCTLVTRVERVRAVRVLCAFVVVHGGHARHPGPGASGVACASPGLVRAPQERRALIHAASAGLAYGEAILEPAACA
jgi:hypothetical protein